MLSKQAGATGSLCIYRGVQGSNAGEPRQPHGDGIPRKCDAGTDSPDLVMVARYLKKRMTAGTPSVAKSEGSDHPSQQRP